jgi:TRAP-type C4-dicarboxylate transport system permease small subunit
MHKLSLFTNRIGEVLLIGFLSALTIVVFLQVLFRYVFHLPLFWTEETARYCLIWASMLGAGCALRSGQHIAVSYMVDRLPAGLYSATMRLAQIFVLAIIVVILWGGVELVFITRNQISPALRIPMSYPYLAMPTGALFMLVHQLALLFEQVPAPSKDACQL